MSNIDKHALRYGDNVLWFLNELAAYDAGDIDGGEFDVYGEDRNGLEGCSSIDVTELAADAAKLIEAAEKRIAELQSVNDELTKFPDQIVSYVARLGTSEIGAHTKNVIYRAAQKVKDSASGIGKGE